MMLTSLLFAEWYKLYHSWINIALTHIAWLCCVQWKRSVSKENIVHGQAPSIPAHLPAAHTNFRLLNLPFYYENNIT